MPYRRKRRARSFSSARRSARAAEEGSDVRWTASSISSPHSSPRELLLGVPNRPPQIARPPGRRGGRARGPNFGAQVSSELFGTVTSQARLAQRSPWALSLGRARNRSRALSQNRTSSSATCGGEAHVLQTEGTLARPPTSAPCRRRSEDLRCSVALR